MRVEDLRGISSLYVARSEDGISDWRFDPKPLLGLRIRIIPRRCGVARIRG